jgi:uncharacterized lipoprotein
MIRPRLIVAISILFGLSACGGDGGIDQTCDEPQRYQRVVPGKRIEVPKGLDPLDEFAEMPIPKPEGAPVRPPGSRCVELPPSIKTGN